MNSDRRRHRCSVQLREILLGFFHRAAMLPIPGADGLTLDDVVDCYRAGIAAGLVPTWEALAQMHPELTEEIKALR